MLGGGPLLVPWRSIRYSLGASVKFPTGVRLSVRAHVCLSTKQEFILVSQLLFCVDVVFTWMCTLPSTPASCSSLPPEAA